MTPKSKHSRDSAQRDELSELMQAIGARQLEVKFGCSAVYEVALKDAEALAAELLTKVRVQLGDGQ